MPNIRFFKSLLGRKRTVVKNRSFEVGQVWKHDTGELMHIIAVGNNSAIWFGPMAIVETPNRELHPISDSPDAIVGWTQVSREEFYQALCNKKTANPC